MAVDVRRAVLAYLVAEPTLASVTTTSWRTSAKKPVAPKPRCGKPFGDWSGTDWSTSTPRGRGPAPTTGAGVSPQTANAPRRAEHEPRDPDGYLERIRREIPDLDDLVELYLTEALRSFNGRCYLATSVMLGVAAERAFLVMAASYAASSLAGAPAMAKELGKPRSNYFALWTEFRKRIEPVRQDPPNGLGDALTLDAIADLIRLTRNEVGHPTGRQIDEDTARVHLAIAPVYLRKMSLLAAPFAGSVTGGVG